MVQIPVKQKTNLQGLVNCRVCPLVPPFPVAASYLGQHISATSGTKRNQDRNQASLLPPLGVSKARRVNVDPPVMAMAIRTLCQSLASAEATRKHWLSDQ